LLLAVALVVEIAISAMTEAAAAALEALELLHELSTQALTMC
jgi:hypothetical protein